MFPVAGDGCQHMGQCWGGRGVRWSAAGLALQSWLHPRLQMGVCRDLDQDKPQGIAQPAGLLLVTLLENRLTEGLAMRRCLFLMSTRGGEATSEIYLLLFKLLAHASSDTFS